MDSRQPAQSYIGRALLTVALGSTLVAPWLADWNATHVFNAHWPPHARFHGAAYLTMAAALSLFGLYGLWTRSADPSFRARVAAIIPVAYWGSFYVALLTPGTGVEDPGHVLPRLAGIPINVVAATGVTLGALTGYGLWHRFDRKVLHG